MICLLAFALFPFQEQAFAATHTVQTTDVKIEVDENFKRPIATKAVEMQGTESTQEFYYTLTKDQTKKENQTITFQISHSELLISPSSFTVKIDNEPIKSVPLNGKKLEQTVKIKLPNSALTEGTHKISVSFYGIVKEGFCVAPGKTGNWLRIEPLSSLPLFTSEAWSLTDYPQAFLSYEDRETTLIIPDHASKEIANQAYQLAAYLSEKSERNVVVKEEAEVNSLKGAVIFLGLKENFNKEYIKQAYDKLNVTDESLSIGVFTLESEKQNVPSLFITATEESQLQDSVTLLTTESLFKQLSGETMQVKQLPQIDNTTPNTIAFEQFGISDLTLMSGSTATQNYYVSLPKVQENREATLRLLLKKSATMDEKVNEQIRQREMELIIYINDVPHSVDLSKLTEIDSDMYEASIPVAASTLNKSKLTTLRLEVTGFHLENPCETTGERYWLYVDSDSSLTIPEFDQHSTFTFMDFPRAFHSNTAIILGEESNVNHHQFVQLYESLIMNGELANIQLIEEKELNDQTLKDSAIIYIGDLQKSSRLSNQKDKILYKEMDFSEAGLLYTETNDFASIGRSIWNEKKPFMLVNFSGNGSAHESLFTRLRDVNEESKLIVYTQDQQLLLGKKVEEDKDVVEKQATVTFNWEIVLPFVLVILFIIVALVIVLRRKKKNTIK